MLNLGYSGEDEWKAVSNEYAVELKCTQCQNDQPSVESTQAHLKQSHMTTTLPWLFSPLYSSCSILLLSE